MTLACILLLRLRGGTLFRYRRWLIHDLSTRHLVEVRLHIGHLLRIGFILLLAGHWLVEDVSRFVLLLLIA